MLPIVLAAALAAAPEIEFAGGYLAGGSNDPTAVALSLRAGVDFADRVTVSGLVLGVPGPAAEFAGGNLAGSVDPSGMQALSALVDVRLHTSAPLQWHVGAGLGIGQLLNWQCADKVNCTESDILHGHVSFAAQGSAGVRYLPPSWHGLSVGAQVAGDLWTGQDDVPNLSQHPPSQQRASARLLWSVLAAIGYHWR